MVSLRIIVFVVVGMSPAEAQTNQLPTATEIFNLRSLCTSLGEKLLQENAQKGYWRRGLKHHPAFRV